MDPEFMTDPVVSVVIPARNAAKTIGQQLDALTRQDFEEPWEIIVVDNASTDETKEVVETARVSLTRLKLLRCDTLGINPARNAGARAARADKILICDADDEADPKWVSQMTRALDHVDIAGGRLEYTKLNTEFISGTRAWLQAGAKLPEFRGRRYAIGANIGFRRSVFDALGGFDETMIGGSDEVDFCLRAEEKGFAIGFVSEAVMSYRFRDRMLPFLRQFYMYALGSAQLDDRLMALGALEPQTSRTLLALGGRHVRALVSVHRLMWRRGRWQYAEQVGWALGAFVGFKRFGRGV
jgi:glycosyltransferase involved in cell wall biosynthesis